MSGFDIRRLDQVAEIARINDHVRKQLDALLQREGITRHGLSRRTGLADTAVSHFFTTSHSPNLTTIAKLFGALGYRVEITLHPIENATGERTEALSTDDPLHLAEPAPYRRGNKRSRA